MATENTTPGEARAVTGRPSRADTVNVAILTALWILMTALVGWGAEFPLNDDWIYAGSAKSIVEHGYFWIPGPAIPNLFAQAWWGALFCLPFGFSFTALRISTLLVGLIGIVALYRLLRRLGAVPLLALAGAAALAVNPVWFNLANGFMTDVPFMTLTILVLLCLARGMGEESRTATIMGLALAYVAILIRQTGLFVLIGYALAYPVLRGVRLTTLVKGALPLLLGVLLHVGFQRWVIGTGRAPDVVLDNVHVLVPSSIGAYAVLVVRYSIVMLPYLGAFIFPLLILTARMPPAMSEQAGVARRGWVLTRMVPAGVAALLLAWVVAKDDGMPVLKNMMYSGGIGPLTLRDVMWLHVTEPAVTPAMAALWLAANAIGVIGAVLLLERLVLSVIVARSAKRPELSLFILLVVTAASYWGAILLLFHWDYFISDRYLLFLLPLAMSAALVIAGAGMATNLRRPRMILAVGSVLVYAAFAVTGMHDYVEWNRARWRGLDHLVSAEKVPPSQIDGGYEFNGWMYRDPRFPARSEKEYWIGNPAQPYLLAYGPVGGYHEVGRYPVARWLPSTYPWILVLHKNDTAG